MDMAKRWYMRAAGVSLLPVTVPHELCLTTIAQQHKRAMQRLTELNNSKNPRSKGRPTRGEASSECTIM